MGQIIYREYIVFWGSNISYSLASAASCEICWACCLLECIPDVTWTFVSPCLWYQVNLMRQVGGSYFLSEYLHLSDISWPMPVLPHHMRLLGLLCVGMYAWHCHLNLCQSWPVAPGQLDRQMGSFYFLSEYRKQSDWSLACCTKQRLDGLKYFGLCIGAPVWYVDTLKPWSTATGKLGGTGV